MDEDNQELKIAALLDAADQAQERLQGAIAELQATGKGLERSVHSAAERGMQGALKVLEADIERARALVWDIKRHSWWRAGLQYFMAALAASLVTVTAIWLYLPSTDEITTLRTEEAQLKASIATLEDHGAKILITHCGQKHRLCVAVNEGAGSYGEKGEYRIAQGY